MALSRLLRVVTGRRVPWWLILLLSFFSLGTLLAVLVVVVVVVIAVAVAGAPAAAPTSGCGTVAVSATAPGLTAEQQGNAQAIASVALGLGLGRPGVLVGVLTANVESDLRNSPTGDRDSIGLFQQRTPWGTTADRMNPITAATMFYTGGQGGQPGLMDVPGWQAMDPGVAMQAVQRSAFAGGTSPNYPQKLAQATAAVEALMVGQPETVAVSAAACTAPAGTGPVPVAFTGGSTGATAPDPTGTGGLLTPATAAMYAAVTAAFPPRSATCWDAHAWNPASDHPLGKACDLFYGTPGVFPTEAERLHGWQVANWIVANASALNVKYLIWDAQFWQGSWGPYGSGIYDTTDPTGGHYDHLHISTTR